MISLPPPDPEALSRFRATASSMQLDPDDQWVGGYVEYEWEHARHIFQVYLPEIARMHVLEFGCNYGASSIVLALLGARVTAVDVNPAAIELAKANAAVYRLEEQIRFLHVEDTTQLPFPAESFDAITCNSVLEYVPPAILRDVQREIDRVLRPGGDILITGTSNRLSPREVHSRRWLVNYLPPGLDRLMFGNVDIERGVFPVAIRYGFGEYENLDWITHGQLFLETRKRRGMKQWKYRLLQLMILLCRPFGVWAGFLLPSLAVALRKQGSRQTMR